MGYEKLEKKIKKLEDKLECEASVLDRRLKLKDHVLNWIPLYGLYHFEKWVDKNIPSIKKAQGMSPPKDIFTVVWYVYQGGSLVMLPLYATTLF